MIFGFIPLVKFIPLVTFIPLVKFISVEDFFGGEFGGVEKSSSNACACDSSNAFASVCACSSNDCASADDCGRGCSCS